MSRPKPLDAPVMRIVLLVFFISFSSFLIRKILRFRFRFAFHAEGTSPGNERQRKVSRQIRAHKSRAKSIDQLQTSTQRALLGDLLTCSRPLHQSSKTKRSTFLVSSEQPDRNAMPCAWFSSAGWCNGSDEVL